MESPWPMGNEMETAVIQAFYKVRSLQSGLTIIVDIWSKYYGFLLTRTGLGPQAITWVISNLY